MKRDSRSHGYVTPIGRVHYGDDVFEPPLPELAEQTVKDVVRPDFAERFHAIVEEMTDELVATSGLDRATCRADALVLLTEASDRLQQDSEVESPLQYLLLEERQKAAATLGVHAPRTLTFTKA